MPDLSFRNRRRISICVTLVALSALALIVRMQQGNPTRVSWMTGGTVLASIVLLALLGLRRRLPGLALGRVSTWTQIHMYLGTFAAGVYLMHVPTLIGGSAFECGLSILFLLVTASGFYGVYASRTLPRRLTDVEGQHRFDHLDANRAQIASQARELVDGLGEQATAGVLGRFYASYLHPFFDGSPSLAYVVVPTGVRRRRLLDGLKQLDGHLGSEGRSTAGRFAELVRQRDDVDYHYAIRLRLRLWLVIHGVCCVALIAGGIVHAVMVS